MVNFKIIMNLLNKINVSVVTYIFLLLSFLAGYFEYMFLLLLFIIIHEFGHVLAGTLFKYKIDEIKIYPFGGLTKFNNLINISLYKEFIVSISGVIIQICFFLFLSYLYKIGHISDITYEKIYLINFSLISFNMLPIIPLDGSKILNIICNYIFNFKTSERINIIISIVFIILIMLLNKKVFIVLLVLLLIKSIYHEMKELKYKYNKFLLERYLYKIKFKSIKYVKSIDNLYRSKYHIINGKLEEKSLREMFDLK